MLRLGFKICAYDKNFSSIWTYTTMMLPRVRNHHGGKCYSAYVRRIVADFSHAPPNEYSPSPNDKKQWSLGCWFGGKLIQKLRQKGVYEESFSRHAAWIGGKLIQFMHTTMVPVQVKTMKIQAGIQVSRPRELTRQLQLWKRFGRLYLIVFVLVRNIPTEYEVDKDTSQSKQNLQSSSMTFIHKTLIIPSVLDSCFISSTVSEVKRYSAYVRRIVADFSHAPPNEYSPSPDDKKQWSLGCWFGGKLIQKLRQKGVYEESFSRHAAWIRGKLIQFMHTTMVPVQVKTMKIQAGIQEHYVMHIEKNVLESILNTLLMNDKSKDTAKARQDMKSLGIRSGLWLGQKQNGKCSKPQAAYSFKPEDIKKFCQFIKGVKLPDGFRSNFKHKVTDNDTNITGLKSHDCHIMMQRLLPYGLQQYLPPDVAKPLIELCLFFKQICSQTLMVDDMLKAQSKVIDILCNLELIYPPAFFDIMIHLVIHLPLEAIFGGPIRPRWMYPFERYMKKLKNYVRNKAKPEGSIVEGYVAEEALTFSSHYFRDVTTKFNRLNRNVDCPPPTCQFQVFKSLCKSIGLRSVICIDHQELKKVIWYVLHNSPEIDTYRAKFKSEFPDNDMKEAFPGRFGKQIRQRHVDNDPGVSKSSELFVLACGPSQTLISVNSCVVNGVRFFVHSRDEHRTTQNSGICSPGPDREMYYGQLEQILKFSYLSFKTVLFRVKWFDTSNKGRMKNLVIRNNITQIKANGEAFKNDQYILATQVKQCFYLEDMAKRPLGWKVVEHVSHKKFSNGGVIVVEDDPDVIHVDNSSDLALSISLNDFEITALHIDGQSIDVDAPPDIIDVVDEDDDIIHEEDPIPYDLADSDDEDLVNLDIDDGVNVVYSSEEED
ncbi:hypothetical protein Tco_0084931 [Tanacetum coccineum]